MAGRPRKSSFIDDLLIVLAATPAWCGPVLALAAFAAFHWAFPFAFRLMKTESVPVDTVTSALANISILWSPWVAIVIIFLWLFAKFRKWVLRRQLEAQKDIESIRELDWSQFEILLEEAFSRQGFRVEHLGDSAPDGGVDLRMSKNGAVILVQCKHWKWQKVPVNVVRELLGVVTSERADSGIVVTSGCFTQDAIDFAKGNPVRLIDGAELVQLIREVQPQTARDAPQPPSVESVEVYPCPVCNAPMKLRTAKRGPKPGAQFWGCSRYPACKGTRNVAAPSATA